MIHQPLAGNVVVIIGGTTGLGLSGARACAAAGGRVVVVGRKAENVDAALAAIGRSARGMAGDAAESDTADRAIRLALAEFGRFDALYHVAGGSGRAAGDGPIHQIPDDGWHDTLRLNLTSVFYSNRAAARQFLAQGTPGSVLNMSSVLGFYPSASFFATHAYAAAKAAIVGLTRTCAAYYARHGIRFNALLPALVETPMAARAAADQATMEYVAARQPLDGGRIGRPDDVDAAVVYFLSGQSRFVTGQALAVDGGWSVSEGRANEP
jgi:NAD(P)-dependent dehydrogenase (short-subunit alcohol dehydrogenase family)